MFADGRRRPWAVRVALELVFGAGLETVSLTNSLRQCCAQRTATSRRREVYQPLLSVGGEPRTAGVASAAISQVRNPGTIRARLRMLSRYTTGIRLERTRKGTCEMNQGRSVVRNERDNRENMLSHKEIGSVRRTQTCESAHNSREKKKQTPERRSR